MLGGVRPRRGGLFPRHVDRRSPGRQARRAQREHFATDAEPEAIAFARRGIYSTAAVRHIPEHMLANYFTKRDGEYTVGKLIRSMVVFGQHDLSRRAPFPRIDLVVCRNVLIYFTTELQSRVLCLFAYSLRDGGDLVLGTAEAIGSQSAAFAVVDDQ